MKVLIPLLISFLGTYAAAQAPAQCGRWIEAGLEYPDYVRLCGHVSPSEGKISDLYLQIDVAKAPLMDKKSYAKTACKHLLDMKLDHYETAETASPYYGFNNNSKRFFTIEGLIEAQVGERVHYIDDHGVKHDYYKLIRADKMITNVFCR